MSSLLASEHIRMLLDEDSVRGVLIRKAIHEAEKVDGEDLRQLEKAVQLLLTRFQAMEGQGS